MKARGTLAITEADDGRLLVICFACYDTPGILAALGLDLVDLFSERIADPSPEARKAAREAFKRNAWSAALSVLDRESTIVLIAARELQAGRLLGAEDAERLAIAVDRIGQSRGVLQ